MTSSSTSARRTWTPARRFALVLGLGYGLVAVAGFATTGLHGFAAHEHATLVVFAVNPLHNVIHSVLAITALVGAFRPTTTRAVDLALGVVLGLVTVLGLLGWLRLLGMSGLADPDNFLHLSTAALALYFGSAAGEQTPDVADDPDGVHDLDRTPERLG